ncbi:MAG: DsbA family protein [Chloroflexia bacterium]
MEDDRAPDKSAQAGGQASDVDLTPPVSERDHSQGTPEAAVTLVVYGDYECPYTRRALGVVRTIQPELGDDLRFVFRNFPLTDIHPHAMHAAEAAEAADAEGRFWEMHRYLFAHQQALEDSDLARYAVEVGLDANRFAHDLAAHSGKVRIVEDLHSGVNSGVQGTPTLFINGARHDASWEHDSLLPALRLAMEHR